MYQAGKSSEHGDRSVIHVKRNSYDVKNSNIFKDFKRKIPRKDYRKSPGI